MVKVGIEVKGNRLRLRVPRSAVELFGIPRYLSTGLDDTTENHQKAQIIAWAIEGDIKAGVINQSLESHLVTFRPQPIKRITQQSNTRLDDLWGLYCEFKKPQLAPTTHQLEYCRKWRNKIAKLPQDVSKPIEIRSRLLEISSIDGSLRLWKVLRACVKWGYDRGLVDSDNLLNTPLGVKLPKDEIEGVIDPFSLSERDCIIEAFQIHKPHYYPFVRFLFLTGCRTSEAIALQWGRVDRDLTNLTFAESYAGALGIRKATKTGKVRKFPCNSGLRELLADIKPPIARSTDLLFPAPKGGYIGLSNFTNRVWRGCNVSGKVYHGVMGDLLAQGSIERYRPVYNTRHTFITLMIESGKLTIPQIARLVGNSPDVILRHYAGSGVDEIPDI